MAFRSFPDVFSWIQNLPPPYQWKGESIHSITLCLSTSSQPSLKLSVISYSNVSFSLSISADYNQPIFLWTSKNIAIKSTSKYLLSDEYALTSLLINILEDVIKYSANRCPYSLKLPRSYAENSINNVKDMVNFSFLTLTFIICIYEAPKDLRASCLNALGDQLANSKTREASKILMRLVGSNVEEQWMRSINLAITNWVWELKSADANLKAPSSLFSYSISAAGLWKLQLYCPVIAMNVEKSSDPSPDERLMFSLNYHQLEGVVQLNHRVLVQEKWIEVMVNIDNIRCDVVKLLTDALLSERGTGSSEKHFPSRVSLQITPITLQPNIISVSLHKSSENPQREIGHEKALEASWDPPTSLGLHFSTGETVTTSLKPWKFEQSVYGSTASLNWFLHDSLDGREVFSSKPSKFALIHPKAWFKNRYSSAYRPFTRQGGVVFARDEYGESVSWKVDKGCMGKCSVEWEVKGWIWLTYWPNKHRTFYAETRRLEFREVLHLNLI